MWAFFFVLALIGILVLLFYIIIELNELDKKVGEFVEEAHKHYES